MCDLYQSYGRRGGRDDMPVIDTGGDLTVYRVS